MAFQEESAISPKCLLKILQKPQVTLVNNP